jgi:hypothetical protein
LGGIDPGYNVIGGLIRCLIVSFDENRMKNGYAVKDASLRVRL